MEAIIVIVGFLGAGKTTLLKTLVKEYLRKSWSPFIILNDYENANVDAQSFLNELPREQVRALSGSCICCSGINEMRNQVNSISKREKGVTLVEANGTTDACTLMGFLGVGLRDHFLPPIQIGIVDVRNWQRRGNENELEANQVRMSSVVILNYSEQVSEQRLKEVKEEIFRFNNSATLKTWSEIDVKELSNLHPVQGENEDFEHEKSHWVSASISLPDPFSLNKLKEVLEKLPKSILRVKGCTKLDNDKHYTMFEKIPSGEIHFKPFKGRLVSGPTLLTIGPGSDPKLLSKLLCE